MIVLNVAMHCDQLINYESTEGAGYAQYLDLNIPLSNTGHIGVSALVGSRGLGFAEIRHLRPA